MGLGCITTHKRELGRVLKEDPSAFQRAIWLSLLPKVRNDQLLARSFTGPILAGEPLCRVFVVSPGKGCADTFTKEKMRSAP
jgi:hypothetical protein